jgi:hypothetical protein
MLHIHQRPDAGSSSMAIPEPRRPRSVILGCGGLNRTWLKRGSSGDAGVGAQETE